MVNRKEMTITAQATDRMQGVVKRLTEKLVDKSNLGSIIAECYAYKVMAKLAKNRYESMRRDIFNSIPTFPTDVPGEFSVYSTDLFALSVIVSQPVKRFDVDEFVRLIRQKAPNVREADVRDMYEKAKVPTQSTVTYVVGEKNNV